MTASSSPSFAIRTLLRANCFGLLVTADALADRQRQHHPRSFHEPTVIRLVTDFHASRCELATQRYATEPK